MRHKLKELRTARGLTQEQLAEALGVHFTTLNRVENKPDLPTKWVERLAGFFHVEPEEIIGQPNTPPVANASPRQLPLFGLAAGSGKGFEKMSEDAIDWVDCPPALANVKDAYCLYVTGNSMVPRYFSGELVFVNPHRLAREGDVVVIQTQIHAQAPVEAAIKVFKDRTKTHIITSQYNPPGDVTFARKHTIGLHRVLTNNELFGL